MAKRTPKNHRAGPKFAARGARAQTSASHADSKLAGQALLNWVDARPIASFSNSPPSRPASTGGLSTAAMPAAANPNHLLTVREVAAVFQVSEKTIRRMVAAGELPVIRLGRSVRLHPKVIEKIVRQYE